MSDPKDVINQLRRAHSMSVSGPRVAADATLYGLGAETLSRVLRERDEAREELRDKRHDGRAKSERTSWARLVPEDVLYPESFSLLGTKTGAGMDARRDGNRLYCRNSEGLLMPIPGEVWQEDSSGRRFLVLATAEYRHHAVIDVTEYVGPIPEEKS